MTTEQTTEQIAIAEFDAVANSKPVVEPYSHKELQLIDALCELNRYHNGETSSLADISHTVQSLTSFYYENAEEDTPRLQALGRLVKSRIDALAVVVINNDRDKRDRVNRRVTSVPDCNYSVADYDLVVQPQFATVWE